MQTYPLFPARTVVDLNGTWEFHFAAQKQLEAFPDGQFTPDDLMTVPGCFDTMPAYYCQRGTGLYRKTFTLDAPAPRAVLKIGGIGLRARFWLDGAEIGTTNVPYSGEDFTVDRPLAAGTHTLVAAIDNMFDKDKMKLFLPYYDFYAFGGFYRGVALHVLPTGYNLERVQVRTLDFRSGKIALRFLFAGQTPKSVQVAVKFDTDTAARPLTLAVHDNAADAEMSVPSPRQWSPAAPQLHTVEVSLWEAGTAQDRIIERFGIREIKTGNKTLLLNGEPLYLQGFNRHESHPQCGAATNDTIMLEDLQNLRALGCNFVRGCHYPQSQRFLDLCDEMGILVWEESLGWGNTPEQLSDPEFRTLQERQTRLMVRNSINHPGVIIWAFLNEFDSGHTAGRELCALLVKAIKEEDASRLVTFACNHTWNDICVDLLDFVAFNTYPGWCDNNYDEEPITKIAPNHTNVMKFFRGRVPAERPIMVSEMGTCGLYGEHDRAGAQWSEEFQCEYLDMLTRTVFADPDVCGLTIWQFNDAKSYLRKGANIRCKPLALNIAGVFDQYRRPKAAAELMQKHFRKHRG